MIILDENILADQRLLLLEWGMPVRQIGRELGRKGMQDNEIIRLLLTLSRPTFFTQDMDFSRRELCHAQYCLAVLDVGDHDAAAFIRHFLTHPQYDTQVKRMGCTVRISHEALYVWRLNQEVQKYQWFDRGGYPAIREADRSYLEEAHVPVDPGS